MSIFANASWPLLTLPHFEARANDYRTISGAESVTFAPIVPDAVREEYEAYTVQEQGWIQQGLDYEYMVTLMEKDNPDNDDYYQSEDEPIAPGTNAEGFSIMSKAKPIQPFIWRNAPLTNRAVPDLAQGPHVPIWQTYPAPRNSYVVGHNLQTIPEFAELIASSQETYMPTLSDIFDNFVLFGNAQTVDVDPKSVLLQPIFGSVVTGENGASEINKNRVDIVGFMVIIKKWRKIFEDVLYHGAKPVVVVLRNTCGKAFTYEILGPRAIFLGEGDLHDTNYDHMEVTSSLSNPGLVSSACNFTLHSFPTRELEEDSMTNMPVFVAFAVLCVFGFTSFVFLIYDWLVSKRQRRVMSAAHATSRIVSNLFPKAVRERMIEDIKMEEKRTATFAAAIAGDASNSAASNHRDTNTFLNINLEGNSHHSRNTDRKGAGTSEDIFGSKPIAELFPATTIMCKCNSACRVVLCCVKGH